MKALSLWQPWASAIALGLKTIETRSWSTAFRGRIAIHASKLVLPAADADGVKDLLDELRLAARRRGHNSIAAGALPRGVIVATAELVDVVPTRGAVVTPHDRRWGDFTAGRFAWVLRDVAPMETIEPARGRQGLWEWTP